MDSSDKLVVALVGFLVVIVCVVCLTVIHTSATVAQMVADGADPISAACALTGNTKTCIVAAGNYE